MSDSTDLRHLFVYYALGSISPEQLQALEAALREDPDLRRDFIEYMNIDSALGDRARRAGRYFAAAADGAVHAGRVLAGCRQRG